jgi:trimeric autotransporter adhesin
MKKIIVVLLFIAAHKMVMAQNVGIGTSTPEASAMLDVTSATKGMLVPRMLTAQRTAIVSPARGLLVFDNTTNSFWFYTGSAWNEVSTTVNMWNINGNSGTNPATNFIGTTDNNDVIFKRNNIRAGFIGTTSTSYGLFALNPASTGILNTANGTHALRFNTTGAGNTANGDYALRENTSGNYNTANGAFALTNNTIGYNNTANGYAALFSNTFGALNTANGYQALYSNTGSANTASGAFALSNNTTGGDNTANGFRALFSNTGGDWNTANGYQALYSNTTGGDNTANGYEALYHNTTGGDNTANGFRVLYSNTTGNSNTAIGNGAGTTNTTGSNLTLIGNLVNVSSNNLTNSTAIGYNASVAISNAMMFGNSSVTEWGLGRTNVSTGVFQVGSNVTNGNAAYLTAGGVWTNTSDVNLKENFTELNDDEMLQKISSLNVTQWNYKNTPVPEIHIGPMAQDFKKLFGLGVAGDDKAIGTIDISGVAIAGVKGLIKKNAELEKSMQQQQAIIQNQQKQIDELKALAKRSNEQQQLIELLQKEIELLKRK